MKKLFALMFVLVFLTGSINAFEINELDDVKVYDSNLKTYSLDNFFGLGRHIAELELKTPQNYQVGLGYQKVAEVEIRNGEQDIEDVINGMQLYNIKNEMIEFDRDVDYKYKVLTEVPNYEYICEDIVHANLSLGKECIEIPSGTRFIESWEDFNSNSLSTGEIITLGIFTTTYEGEHIEWIMNVYGNERLVEWAEWTASLNTGLVSYYKLDEVAGTNVWDVFGNNNATADNAGVFTSSITGRINTGADFTNDYVATLANTPFAGTTAFSVSTWVIMDWSNSANWGVITSSTKDDTNDWLLRKSGSNAGFTGLLTTGTDATNLASANGLGDGLYHVVMTWNGTGASLWVNNTVRATDADIAGTMTDTDKVFTIGSGEGANSARYMEIMVDEIAIYNRSLSDAEITQFYNSGLGIQYTPEPADNSPSVVLNSPVNEYNSTSQTIIFNTTVADDVNLINVSLYLDGVLNETNSSGLNNSVYLFTKTFAEGSYNWSIQAWDNASQSNTSNVRNFSVDSTVPYVAILSPTGNLTLDWNTQNVSYWINSSDLNLEACWYSEDSLTTNVTYTCGTNVTRNLGSGSNTLIACANDSLSNQNCTSEISYTTSLYSSIPLYFNGGALSPTCTITHGSINSSLFWLGENYVRNNTLACELAGYSNDEWVIKANQSNYNLTMDIAHLNLTFTDYINATINPYSGSSFVNVSSIYVNQSDIPIGYVSITYNKQGSGGVQIFSYYNDNVTSIDEILEVLTGTFQQVEIEVKSAGLGLENTLVSVQKQVGGAWTEIYSTYTNANGDAIVYVNPDDIYKFIASKIGYTTGDVTKEVLTGQVTPIVIILDASATAEDVVRFYSNCGNKVADKSCYLRVETSEEKTNLTIISFWNNTYYSTTCLNEDYCTTSNYLIENETGLLIGYIYIDEVINSLKTIRIEFDDLDNRIININWISFDKTNNVYLGIFYFISLIVGLFFVIAGENKIKGSGIYILTIWFAVLAMNGFAFYWFVVLPVIILKTGQLIRSKMK